MASCHYVAKKKVLIVDDHPILRRGLRQVIDDEPDLAVCGEASTLVEATKTIEKLNPDVAVVDLSLAHEDGLLLVRTIKERFPHMRSLVLSMHEEATYAERALSAGAWGYIMKRSAGEGVVEAIRCILKDQIYLSERMKARMLLRMTGRRREPETSLVSQLTDQELQVFRLTGQGLETREIAKRMHLSVKTIETYRERIKRKLGLSTFVELVQRAALWVHDNERT